LKLTGTRREVIPQTNCSWFRPFGGPKGHAVADDDMSHRLDDINLQRIAPRIKVAVANRYSHTLRSARRGE